METSFSFTQDASIRMLRTADTRVWVSDALGTPLREIVDFGGLSLEQALHFAVSKLRYKPDCFFSIHYDLPQNAYSLYASCEVPDVDADAPSAPKVTIGAFQPISTVMWNGEWNEAFEKCFTDTVRKLVRNLECHEVDEWLRFDGKRVTEPHPPPPPLYWIENYGGMLLNEGLS